MTSAQFATVFISSITVNRDGRQRRELTDIDGLAESIRLNGLIHPPVITRENTLVVGERRIAACLALGWSEITIQYIDTLDPLALKLVELEENVRRVNLSWQDHNKTITAYHHLCQETKSDWNKSATAAALGVDRSLITKHLMVERARKAVVNGIADAPKFSTALGIAQRNEDRKGDTAKENLFTEIEEVIGGVPAAVASEQPESTRPLDIITTSFHKWTKQVQIKPYNFIHCDFPYGIGTGDKHGQSAAKSHGHYEDTADVYFELINTLLINADNFIAPSAHLMFWFSMDYYQETCDLLKSGGWVVNPFPLIWLKSDNKGILPDANRGPRRIYETALLASRGDRKIVRAVGNAVASPTTQDYHQAEKPLAVLEHFFRMLVDESTMLLDPTCGSGMAVRAAEALGAKYALGLELDPEFADRARMNLEI